MWPAFEFIDRKRHAAGAFGQIWRVDLRKDAQADNLRTRASAGDQRFHLLWGQILRFVDDHVFV